jgi:F0F1-type ATP synthase membrane subunit b/b'
MTLSTVYTITLFSSNNSSNQQDHIQDLEERIVQLKERNKEISEYYKQELHQEREKWKKIVADLKEEHEEAVQILRTEHTLVLDQVRTLQEQ